MKKVLLITLSVVFSFNVYSQSGNFCEDFESFSNGDPVCQTSTLKAEIYPLFLSTPLIPPLPKRSVLDPWC